MLMKEDSWDIPRPLLPPEHKNTNEKYFKKFFILFYIGEKFIERSVHGCYQHGESNQEQTQHSHELSQVNNQTEKERFR